MGGWGHWCLDPLSRAGQGLRRWRAGPLSGAKGPLEVSSCGPWGWVLMWTPQGELPARELPLRGPCRVPTPPHPSTPTSHWTYPAGRRNTCGGAPPCTWRWSLGISGWSCSCRLGFAFFIWETHSCSQDSVAFLGSRSDSHFPPIVLCVVHTVILH